MTSPDVCDYYSIEKLGNRLTLVLNTAKNTNYMKKVSNKSCLDLNFLQNSHWAHVYINPPSQSGARGRERLACLKYDNVWKHENRLTLGLNAAENTNYMEKISNKSYLELNSHSWRICLSLHRVEIGGSKDWYDWNIIMNKTANYIHFRAERCEKYRLYGKKV